jgi:hypothetical protein
MYEEVYKARTSVKNDVEGAGAARGASRAVSQAVQAVERAELIAEQFAHEWLLRLEAIELAVSHLRGSQEAELERRLKNLGARLVVDFKDHPGDLKWLVEQGLAQIH